MKNYLIFKWFLSILVITLISTIHAQEQLVKQIEPKQEEITIYKVSEIPIKLEETSAFISDLYDNVLKPEEVKDLEAQLNQILKNYSSLKAQTDSVKLEEQLTTTLKEFQQRWNFQKNEITDWSDEVTSKTEDLEEQKKVLLEKRDIWLRTDTLARKEKANRNILNKIRGILNEFNKVENLTVNEINNSLNLQTKLSKQSVDVDLTIKQIDGLLLAKKREILVRNAPPLWKSTTGRLDTVGISDQAKNIWNSYRRTVEDFTAENKDKFISSIIYFLLLLLLILFLRHYTKKLPTDDPKVIRATKILKAPVSAAILISLFTLVFLYDSAPEIFISFMRIIVVFPLIIVLIRIINPVLRLPLYLFALLLILQQIKQTAATDTEIERVLLIAINIIALGGLIWLLVTKRFDKAFSKESDVHKAKVIIKITMVVFIITLVANIIGYVMLSITLINAAINSTYGIILLLTATLTLEGVIVIFLHTKLATSLNVVKNYPEKIESKLHRILNLVIVVLSIIIILNNLGIRQIVFDWLGDTLTHEWAIGSFSITLGNIIIFIISIWLAIIIARFVRFILEGDVLPRLNLPRGVPGAVSIMTSYLIIGFGIIVAIMGAGIDLNSFALLAGALGVGIGFGLQNIVNNFISGLILIFERPIQIGDAVQVEELSGRVTHIGIRSSTIKTWDGAEVIVPNGNLISNKLINWTLSDQRRRIDIKVGVAYGTDISLAMETLLECAKKNEKILIAPVPYVLFNDFGESSLDFELRCWTSDFASWVEIRSDIRVAIDEAFEKEEIVIPYPQRDLHIITDKTKEKDEIGETETRKKRQAKKVKSEESKKDKPEDMDGTQNGEAEQ
ncbi:MAG: mechanosensitive ion channel [Ignavibacteriaceae bacterium]|nr:mechanosensitive ion channel [Ignavibacteriaceae bacterium]